MDLARAVQRAAGALPERVRDRVRLLVAPHSVDRRDHGALIAAAAALPFEEWERQGWHLTPNSYLSTIPDTRRLPARLWSEESELPGIDLRDGAQVRLLAELADRFGPELAALPRTPEQAGPGGYHLANGAFEAVDAEIYHAMIRLHRPATVLEIGSGWSTLLALAALRANAAGGAGGRLVAVEPHPYEFLVRAVAGAGTPAELRRVSVQEVPLAEFTGLRAGDILFIDSSHVLKIGSDVQYELLEVLPRLAPGVLVHLHDIFLPGEYPRDWVLGPEHRFWNEQYLLQAYLAGNARVEVLWAGSWMHRRHPELLGAALPSYDRSRHRPGSFWFRTL